MIAHISHECFTFRTAVLLMTLLFCNFLAAETQQACTAERAPLSAATPYSAEQVTHHKQTLIDGTHIDQVLQRSFFYRDSRGRTRFQRFFNSAGNAIHPSSSTIIEIKDPISGYRIILDAQSQTAQRSVLSPSTTKSTTEDAIVKETAPANPSMVPAAGAQKRSGKAPLTAQRSLGKRCIDGIPAEGTEVVTCLEILIHS